MSSEQIFQRTAFVKLLLRRRRRFHESLLMTVNKVFPVVQQFCVCGFFFFRSKALESSSAKLRRGLRAHLG